MKNIPDWIADYRKRIEENNKLFGEDIERILVSSDTSRKFTPSGEARAFHGFSLVFFVEPESELMNKLSDTKNTFHSLLQRSGIGSAFAFLPTNTYHITLVGIATNQSEKIQQEIVRGVHDCFNTFRTHKIHPPKIVVRGDLSLDGSTIIAPIEPEDIESLDTIYYIRDEVRKRLHPLGKNIVRNTPHNFHGHISLAYIVKNLAGEDYKKLKKIIQIHSTSKPIGKTVITSVSFSRFETIVDWGAPLSTFSLID